MKHEKHEKKKDENLKEDYLVCIYLSAKHKHKRKSKSKSSMRLTHRLSQLTIRQDFGRWQARSERKA